MSNAEKKSTFFGGAAILAASAILVKVIGAIYRIPLGNILSDEVMADYNSAYNIYNFFLTISTAGLPVALSKTISEANALGRHNQVQRTFRVAFLTFLTLGLISFFCMTVLAAPMAQVVISNPKAVYCVMALAPSVLCVCIMSAFRGYFQGHFNMMPTGISQVIEAFFKLVVGLALAWYLVGAGFGLSVGAAGAIMGVTISTVLALGYMIVSHLRHRNDIPSSTDTPAPSKTLLKRLLAIGIPITIGASGMSLITLIDQSLIMGRLQDVLGLSEQAAAALNGQYEFSMTLFNLPSSFIPPITMSLVPAVSAALTRRDHQRVGKLVNTSLRLTTLLAFPAGVGLSVLAGPILILLYPALCIPDDLRAGRLLEGTFDPVNLPETIPCGSFLLGRRYVEDMAGADAFQLIRGFPGDVLLVHGDADRAVDLSYSQRAYQLYRERSAGTGGSRTRLEVMVGGGHGFTEAESREVIRYMREFLA